MLEFFVNIQLRNGNDLFSKFVLNFKTNRFQDIVSYLPASIKPFSWLFVFNPTTAFIVIDAFENYLVIIMQPRYKEQRCFFLWSFCKCVSKCVCLVLKVGGT